MYSIKMNDTFVQFANEEELDDKLDELWLDRKITLDMQDKVLNLWAMGATSCIIPDVLNYEMTEVPPE
jgi:frataxin-like iron-binding protein CyaY